jgi:hypothetical protein
MEVEVKNLDARQAQILTHSDACFRVMHRFRFGTDAHHFFPALSLVC